MGDGHAARSCLDAAPFNEWDTPMHRREFQPSGVRQWINRVHPPCATPGDATWQPPPRPREEACGMCEPAHPGWLYSDDDFFSDRCPACDGEGTVLITHPS